MRGYLSIQGNMKIENSRKPGLGLVQLPQGKASDSFFFFFFRCAKMVFGILTIRVGRRERIGKCRLVGTFGLERGEGIPSSTGDYLYENGKWCSEEGWDWCKYCKAKHPAFFGLRRR